MNPIPRAWLTLAALSVLAMDDVAAQGKNLLFYGNSLTYYVFGYGVPEVVGKLAVEAGHPAPTIVTSLVGGGTLQTFASDPMQIAAIASLPPGQTWDRVVMQGHLLEATDGAGFQAANFRSAALAILANVRAHSPAAQAVMFQTWAPAWGQMYYPLGWPTPLALHAEVRGNYRLAVQDLEAAFGAGAAVDAAVGDAVALLEWQRVWYEADLFHPSPSMILLAAMVIYSSIYELPVCAIEPSWTPAGPIAQALAPYGIDAAAFRFLAGIADRSAAPGVRPYPGSGDWLLLAAGIDGAGVTACPRHVVTTGSLLAAELRSRNGAFDPVAAWLLADLAVSGAPPAPWSLHPEVQLDLAASLLLAMAPTLTNPLQFAAPVPFTLPGLSLRLQGIAFGSSAATGNPQFSATDAHELVFH